MRARWVVAARLVAGGRARTWRTLSLGVVAALFLIGLLGEPLRADAHVAHDKPSERPHRIVRKVNDRDTRVVRGSLHALATRDFEQGRVDASLVLERVAIVFKPSATQQRELEALLAEQRDPNSPGFRRWLSPDEYAARFGMSDADLDQVRAWLFAQGLTVQAISRSRNELYFRGTAAQIEDAFRTELHRYRVGDELHYANATEPSVPAAFADVVLAIRKLSDFRPEPRLRRPVAAPRFTSAISGNHFLAPDDFATIYNVKPLWAAGWDGTGQRIAVIGQTALGPGNSAADIDAFRAASGLPPTLLQQVLVPGSGASTVCDDDILEAHLDVQWSGAVARNATIVYVYTGVRSGRTCETADTNVWDALQHAITNNLAPVVSTSYGACEAANGQGFAQTVRGWVQQANAQGQTVTAASGDLGAADCEPRGSQSASSGLAVDMPSSIPEVTGVGGTRFVGDVANAATYWSATNNASNGSALQYIGESGWDDSSVSILLGGGLSSSGGGASRYFSKPVWQSGLGVPADGRRDVPDVALNASALHDPYLICSQGSCVDGYRRADLTLNVIGGTSAGAPTFAGILALINQGTGSSGLGNVNPKLYALAASTPAAFHDITTGTNIVPCSSGSPSCPVIPPFQFGYTAGAGYDQVTGLGSVDAFALADGWATKVATSTTIAASSTAVAPGANATFTATVAALAPGTGSPAGGRVQFSVDGSAIGAPVTVARVGSAYRAHYTTNALATGMRSVEAAYLGNLAHLPSSSTPIAVNVADYSVSASPASIVLSAGGTGTSILTVTTADGFAGTVNLACAVPAGATGVSCSASPSALTLGVGVPTQTATLTITTTAAQARSLPVAGGSLLAAVLLLGLPSRRGRRTLLRVVAVLAVAGVGLSCGGGGGGGGGGASSANATTPVGSYALTVNATSGAIAHAVGVSLVVQ